MNKVSGEVIIGLVGTLFSVFVGLFPDINACARIIGILGIALIVFITLYIKTRIAFGRLAEDLKFANENRDALSNLLTKAKKKIALHNLLLDSIQAAISQTAMGKGLERFKLLEQYFFTVRKKIAGRC